MKNSLNKFIGYLQFGFAIFLYLLSAGTFISYMYALTIRDTVSAIESAFGTLVILVFMLVMAKFLLVGAKKRLGYIKESVEKAESEQDEKMTVKESE